MKLSPNEAVCTRRLELRDRVALRTAAVPSTVHCRCRRWCRRWRSCRPHGSVGLVGRQQSCVNGLHAGRASKGTHEPVVNTVFVISMHTRQETQTIAHHELQHADHTPAKQCIPITLKLIKPGKVPSYCFSRLLCLSIFTSWYSKHHVFVPFKDGEVYESFIEQLGMILIQANRKGCGVVIFPPKAHLQVSAHNGRQKSPVYIGWPANLFFSCNTLIIMHFDNWACLRWQSCEGATYSFALLFVPS